MKGLFLVSTILIFSNLAVAGELRNIAKNTLEKNIYKIGKVHFLAAGAHQFKSFWTRDFALSVNGLLMTNHEDVVKEHLDYLISHKNKDQLIPLYADSISPILRVINNTVCRALKINLNLLIDKNIKPYYLVNGKYPAIDSNILTLLAAKRYSNFTGNKAWFNSHQKAFFDIFHYYDNKIDDLLIIQDEHSDWQDSAKRKGKTFFTNLIYFQVARDYKFLSIYQLEQLRQKIIKTFFDNDKGLFKSVEGQRYISLDGNLWAIDNNLIMDSELLYKNLKAHPLFQKYDIPGFTTYPSYDSNEIYSQVKLVGIQEYHGNIFWSWLIGLSAKVAYQMHDLAKYDEIMGKISYIIKRDQTIYEIYDNSNEHKPYQTQFYFSEAPFSLGASSIIELLDFVKTNKN